MGVTYTTWNIAVLLYRTTYLGMSDPAKTFDFRWTDGTIMMWAMWTNGQPTHWGGLEPYGSIYSNRFYNDAPINIEYKGLCEKSGKWNFFI